MSKESVKNTRLLKLYGHTLAEKEAFGKACMICGRVPENGILHMDHWHKVRYFKVQTEHNEATRGWKAYVKEFPKCAAYAGTKEKAIQGIRFITKKLAVRGVLCYPCNTALGKLARKGRENPEWLRAAAKYLEDYNAKNKHS